MRPWGRGCWQDWPSSRITAICLASMALVMPASARGTVTIQGTGWDGITRELDVSRTPALYTGDFDDCLLGQSLFNITKFDAAYYADNMTVLFHLDGTTNIRRENLMIHMAVEAYGESRFDMTYDPCKANISSMCPLNGTMPVEAFVVIPMTPKDVKGIPSIDLALPDLEGFARLQIYANSTQTMIGCFQAVITNGQTFSQPKTVGSILGAFVVFASVSSFLTTIYGLRLSVMRSHYAHSFSVLVIFETFQSIFLTGALSVSWPSVLPAWWSNFAWTVGMFAPRTMVRALSSFTGINGNVTQVGGAGSTYLNTDGGMAREIYGLANSKRSGIPMTNSPRLSVERAPYNASDPYDYNWNGQPRVPGMPMPGTWPGFAGTLSASNIPPAEAFTLCLIWILVVLAGFALAILLAKVLIDVLIKIKWLGTDGFDYFRNHVGIYVRSGVLRILYIAFFAVLTLSMYQFTLSGPAGVTALSAVIFVVFLTILGGLAALACLSRTQKGKFESGPDRILLESGTIFQKVPFVAATRASKVHGTGESNQSSRVYASIPWYQLRHVNHDPLQPAVHEDEANITRFGWLTARYRRTRWWFFVLYLFYQLTRAAFLGAGRQSPLAQVYGLFVFEILALIVIIKIRPFEGSRNNTAAVWLLSISKIVTTGLSIAFLPDFDMNRISATVLGIIIIVVQAFLAVAIMVLVILGLITTWMSLSRNHEDFVKPLEQTRIKYFENIEKTALDGPQEALVATGGPLQPAQPSFNVKSVRRHPHMEDLQEVAEEDGFEASTSAQPNPAAWRRSRANSAASRWSNSSRPRAARVHRASWSARDFAQTDAEMESSVGQLMGHSRSSSLHGQAIRHSGGPSDNAGQWAPMLRPMTPAREVSEERVATLNSATGEQAPKVKGVSSEEKRAALSACANKVDEKKLKAGCGNVDERAAEAPLTHLEAVHQQQQ